MWAEGAQEGLGEGLWVAGETELRLAAGGEEQLVRVGDLHLGAGDVHGDRGAHAPQDRIRRWRFGAEMGTLDGPTTTAPTNGAIPPRHPRGQPASQALREQSRRVQIGRAHV